MIDLRSDTVTRPTAAMRQAMAQAEVGDDVFGDDPTVRALEERVADLLGKEAALLVPSGTMANQIALRAQLRPGDEVLIGKDAHCWRFESGALAALAGAQSQTLPGDGRFEATAVRAAFKPDEPYIAPTTVVAVENTHNASGGRIFPFEQVRAVVTVAKERGLRLHLDGARLWNAVVASGTAAPAWVEGFDSVSFCLSKGLGAPAGSLVCGSAELIDRVHRVRKMLGGGMRQAGILAAAGLYALEHHVERLADDHGHARRLAEGLTALGLDVDAPQTNMVFFRGADVGRLWGALLEREVLINPVDRHSFRAVTHLNIAAEDIDDALGRIGEALGGLRA